MATSKSSRFVRLAQLTFKTSTRIAATASQGCRWRQRSFDPLSHAEKITGQSYKTSKATSDIGFALHLDHSETKRQILALAKDVYFGMPLDEYLETIKSCGFEQVLCIDIPSTKDSYGSNGDKYYIFWCDGLLLAFDTYSNHTCVNGGNLLFQWKPNTAADSSKLPPCSRSMGKETDSFAIGEDCREGLAHFIAMAKQHGTILAKWNHAPFLWLLHYMDTKVGGYDYKAINKTRIGMLPPHVRDAIKY